MKKLWCLIAICCDLIIQMNHILIQTMTVQKQRIIMVEFNEVQALHIFLFPPELVIYSIYKAIADKAFTQRPSATHTEPRIQKSKMFILSCVWISCAYRTIWRTIPFGTKHDRFAKYRKALQERGGITCIDNIKSIHKYDDIVGCYGVTRNELLKQIQLETEISTGFPAYDAIQV